MPIIRLATRIVAPVERCFDLARDIDLHQDSLGDTAERAVAGATHGLIGDGEWVTWEAIHFGVRQRLTSEITAFVPPHYFVDEQRAGAFARFTHLHLFRPFECGTLMIDHFDFTSPLGPLGRLADILFLERYMRRLLQGRNAAIKGAAERGCGTMG